MSDEHDPIAAGADVTPEMLADAVELTATMTPANIRNLWLRDAEYHAAAYVILRTAERISGAVTLQRASLPPLSPQQENPKP